MRSLGRALAGIAAVSSLLIGSMGVTQAAGALDPGKIVAQRDLDIGIRLVVLEPDVELGLVALDEVAFEQERLGDRVRDRVLDFGNPIATKGIDAATISVNVSLAATKPCLSKMLAGTSLFDVAYGFVRHCTQRHAHFVQYPPKPFE